MFREALIKLFCQLQSLLISREECAVKNDTRQQVENSVKGEMTARSFPFARDATEPNIGIENNRHCCLSVFRKGIQTDFYTLRNSKNIPYL